MKMEPTDPITPGRPRLTDDRVLNALRTLKTAAELDGSAVIYLHDAPDQESFGVLLLNDKQPLGLPKSAGDIALDGLEKAGWNPYDHSHLDGEGYDDD